MSWLRVTLNISGDEIENCENLLLEQGAISVSLENNDSEAVLEPELGKTPFWKSVKLTALFEGSSSRSNLNTMLNDCFYSNTFNFELIDDKNWLDEHKKNSQAIAFNNRLCICPSWITPPKDVPAILKIDPGLAFGTGEHSTTSLCLERLSEIPLGSKYIVDFGCGSGILALAALKLDAKKALGIDIDPQALAASKKNAQINNLDQALELALPDDSKTTDWLGKADIVIAAVGRPEIVKGSWIKNGAVVIDVGINRIEVNINGENKNKLVGDVDFTEAEKNASAITPVPGGVGPMTIACLLRNTTIAFKNSQKN